MLQWDFYLFLRILASASQTITIITTFTFTFLITYFNFTQLFSWILASLDFSFLVAVKNLFCIPWFTVIVCTCACIPVKPVISVYLCMLSFSFSITAFKFHA